MLISQGQTILFEGDSLTSRNSPPAHDTWPFLRLMNWDRTYADVIQEWLFANRPELDLKFRNSAVGGSSAGQILGRFDAIVPAVRPNWTIMTTAHNDAARKIPLEQFRNELSACASKARETCGARLFITGGFKPCPGLPADHPLYHNHYDIKQVEYTPRVHEDFGQLSAPELEGITIDGKLAVIYSRFDLGNGWEQFPHAYSYGYKDESALQIGTNVIVYAMTH